MQGPTFQRPHSESGLLASLGGVGGILPDQRPLSSRDRRFLSRIEADSRLSDEEKRERQEIADEDRVLAKAFASLTGEFPSNISAAFDLVYAEPDSELRSAFIAILRSGIVSEPAIKKLEREIQAYEVWAKKAEANTTFTKLAMASYEEPDVRAALLAAGARYFRFAEEGNQRIYCDGQPTEGEINIDFCLEGDHPALETAPECFGRFLEFRTAATNQSRAFVAFLKDIIELGPKYTAIVLNRFIEITTDSNAVFYEHMPDHMVKSLVARCLAFSPSTIPAIRALQPLVADIKKMRALNADRVVDLLQGGESLQPVLTAILPRVEKAVTASPLSLRTVEEVLSKAPLTERYDLFDVLLKNPELLLLIRAVKKYQGNESELFLKLSALSGSHPSQTREFLAALTDMIAAGDRPVAVAYAIGVDESMILNDDSREQLLAFVRTQPKCHLLMSHFVEALRNNDCRRCAIIMSALARTQNGTELQLFASRLDLLSHDELGRRFEAGQNSADLVAAGLFAKKVTFERRISVPSKPNATPTSAGTPWIDRLTSEFAGGKLDNRALISEADVRTTYERLGNEYRGRLRGVWQQCPQAVAEFCSDVMSYSGRPWFDLIVRDSYLFARYRERLSAQPIETRSRLDQFAAQESSSSSAEVREWLSAEHSSALPFEVQRVSMASDRVPPQALARPFGRVIIWGHFHSAERRGKLEEAAGEMPLRLHDTFGRRLAEKAAFRPDDVVICLTNAMSHKHYYAIKAAALGCGAQIICTIHEGTEILVQIVKTISENRKAA